MEQTAGVAMADLAALVDGDGPRQPAWAYQGTDLNANLLVFAAGEGVPEHVNSEVDVLILCLAGSGMVEVDGAVHPLGAGRVIVVPKGLRRATRCTGDRFAYLTCHRRRAGLWPTRGRRSSGEPPDSG